MSNAREGVAVSAPPPDIDPRFDQRFHETWPERLRRWALGAGYALRPPRLALLPRLWRLTLDYYLTPKASRDALRELPRRFYSERGLVGISDDLSVPALVANYARGFFPVCHVGPMKWWCPDERAVLDPAETHISHNVRRLLRRHKFTVTMDKDFAGVIKACAQPRGGKVPLTWITPRIMRAYWDAYEAGYAHSVEVWDEAGHLVGGVYGLAIGKVYFGESKFSAASDASKVATAVLHRHLVDWGYKLCDAKWMTPHLETLGFKAITRDEFLSLLPWYLEDPGPVGHWAIDPGLDLAGPKRAKKATDRSSAPGSVSRQVA